MTKMLSALVTASMLGLAGAASAAEPVTLTDGQLDTISAGAVLGTASPLIGTTGAATNRIAGQSGTVCGLGSCSANSGGTTPATTSVPAGTLNFAQLGGS